MRHSGGGFGLVGNLIVGVIGALLGGFVFGLLGISAGGLIGSIITATVGAIVLLFIVGVARVEEAIEVAGGVGTAATFYTVHNGGTPSAISKKHYGDAGKYMAIFEANKPMLSAPDKIYPGQVFRIPSLTAAEDVAILIMSVTSSTGGYQSV